MEGLVGDFDDWELSPENPAVGNSSKGEEAWEDDEECGGQECAAAAAAAEEEEEGCGSEAGDLTCAICLAPQIQLEELAMVKGCDHMYCVKCILEWAMHKEQPWCPQCKMPFSYLLTYRNLDGSLQDFPSEESVCLLKRARWFEDHMRSSEKGKALLEESRLQDDTAWQDWADEYGLDSDDEIEAFYFSSAAGRARVIGNRRFGEGGYISGGRRQARPAPGRGKNKISKPVEHTAVATPSIQGGSSSAAPASFRTPNAGGGRRASAGAAGASGSGSAAGPSGAQHSGAASSAPRSIAPRSCGSAGGASAGGQQGSSGQGGSGSVGGAYGSSPSGSRSIYGSSPSAAGCGIYGSSPAGSGRRARRNARRAAQDYADAWAY